MSAVKRALIYCEGHFRDADGKTAHGLVRHTTRFEVTGVVDSTSPEGDAGIILDGVHRGIPLYRDLSVALEDSSSEVFVNGAAFSGGALPSGYRDAIATAMAKGLDVVSGLHQYVSDDRELSRIAEKNGCDIVDVRKMFSGLKRFYTGEVGDLPSTRIAMLGTDSAIGKRTTAVLLVEELRRRGRSADMIFTGQTGWMQGWPHGIVLDAMVNDFISGGLEGAMLDSWRDESPEFMIIEGQGSLVHPFFPGGYEILAAGRVHGFILQDAPGRKHLDGFPEFPMPDPGRVVDIARLMCERPLIGISINPEGLTAHGMNKACAGLGKRFGVPVEDPVGGGATLLADAVERTRDG
ncbi:MAG: DUF1611 domain-containing protein [Thermoplasmata archaeon]|nr:DUF1611 domain-containing protein [Thermoplasmata archaeon]